jgi:hypothetical protein
VSAGSPAQVWVRLCGAPHVRIIVSQPRFKPPKFAISNILKLTISGRLSSEEAGRLIDGISVAMSAMRHANPRRQTAAILTEAKVV